MSKTNNPRSLTLLHKSTLRNVRRYRPSVEFRIVTLKKKTDVCGCTNVTVT